LAIIFNFIVESRKENFSFLDLYAIIKLPDYNQMIRKGK